MIRKYIRSILSEADWEKLRSSPKRSGKREKGYNLWMNPADDDIGFEPDYVSNLPKEWDKKPKKQMKKSIEQEPAWLDDNAGFGNISLDENELEAVGELCKFMSQEGAFMDDSSFWLEADLDILTNLRDTKFKSVWTSPNIPIYRGMANISKEDLVSFLEIDPDELKSKGRANINSKIYGHSWSSDIWTASKFAEGHLGTSGSDKKSDHYDVLVAANAASNNTLKADIKGAKKLLTRRSLYYLSEYCNDRFLFAEDEIIALSDVVAEVCVWVPSDRNSAKNLINLMGEK